MNDTEQLSILCSERKRWVIKIIVENTELMVQTETGFGKNLPGVWSVVYIKNCMKNVNVIKRKEQKF